MHGVGRVNQLQIFTPVCTQLSPLSMQYVPVSNLHSEFAYLLLHRAREANAYTKKTNEQFLRFLNEFSVSQYKWKKETKVKKS